MVIEGNAHEDITATHRGKESFHIEQQSDIVVIDKKQAKELALVLSKFASDEGVITGKHSMVVTDYYPDSAVKYFLTHESTLRLSAGSSVVVDKVERVE